MNAELRPVKTAAEIGLADLFAAVRKDLPGGSSIEAIRSDAFDRFAAQGLPNSRVEAWRCTDLRRLVQDAKPLARRPDAAAKTAAGGAGAVFAGLHIRRLLIVDGAFVPELSDLAALEAGVAIRATVEALRREEMVLPFGMAGADPVAALNTALAGDGVVITVAADVVVERPIHLVFVTTGAAPAAMFTRSRLELGHGASLTLIETHEGPDHSDYQVNAALQMDVGDKASLDHIKITSEGAAALHIATLEASIGVGANYREFGFTTGGAVVRNQLFLRLAGEGTIASVHQASLLSGRQHADTTLTVDHAAAGSQSREVFKAVVDDEARAVFQGRITVQPGAQQTDARMMARALLLSDEAVASCKPELEIFADDVQCGHGTTTGALDDQLKFYLMARGIPEKEAEALLIQAFVGEVIDAVAREDLRDALSRTMHDWLKGRE
ncbi:Fe-S cluster assembly protein SufD [Bradyrhizobium sacchari]|uniref:Iron-regulated ABC transporter permease protein SufD n=1 Tax=Bradyrhizobium sacchari TaxID=1399419 RepID=A0A560JJE1_9BRAD|nr:Fe-S cluster assembly protein SufD [Bradyrhizobium sacchari]OPY98501.1 Fe-S cluster assembly protein SufD [Bradyrhizobium sacchari]TWB57044.1 iron-regulated ABC transporter permease protein SufD [Bradyrhizobium sacchari]TWB71321.1 iron-regulated ABC transporter permease protein SufD [Bradyrhizobium sacchari]